MQRQRSANRKAIYDTRARSRTSAISASRAISISLPSCPSHSLLIGTSRRHGAAPAARKRVLRRFMGEERTPMHSTNFCETCMTTEVYQMENVNARDLRLSLLLGHICWIGLTKRAIFCARWRFEDQRTNLKATRTCKIQIVVGSYQTYYFFSCL